MRLCFGYEELFRYGELGLLNKTHATRSNATVLKLFKVYYYYIENNSTFGKISLQPKRFKKFLGGSLSVLFNTSALEVMFIICFVKLS